MKELVDKIAQKLNKGKLVESFL